MDRTLRTVTVGEQQLRVDVRPGTGGGPPLVLANGIGASLELLDPFVERLDPAIEVVRFDVPGVGGSPQPRRPYTLHLLARTVGRLLDELGHDRFDVLGISWGGALAQQLAFANPRRCRRVVLVATGTGNLMVPAHPRVLSKMITPRRYRDPAYAERVAPLIYGGSVRTEPERARELLHAHSRAGTRRGYYLQLLASAGWTSVPWLRFIRQPTLVLAGDDDPIIPLVNARVLGALLPRGRVHVYPGGHLALVLQADQLAPLVADFLRDEPPRRVPRSRR
ncbi:MAG: poly(3-hydroxyalkanoate) depolymerase [Nitriliruptor sp.]